MSKIIRKFFTVVFAVSPLVGCSSTTNGEYKDISYQDILQIYNESNYDTFVSFIEEGEEEYNAFISCISNDNEDKFIYFYVFDTKEEASKYSNEHKWNHLLYFFSSLFGDPLWITSSTYNNLVIEYSSKDAYKPFNELTKTT